MFIHVHKQKKTEESYKIHLALDISKTPETDTKKRYKKQGYYMLPKKQKEVREFFSPDYELHVWVETSGFKKKKNWDLINYHHDR